MAHQISFNVEGNPDDVARFLRLLQQRAAPTTPNQVVMISERIPSPKKSRPVPSPNEIKKADPVQEIKKVKKPPSPRPLSGPEAGFADRMKLGKTLRTLLRFQQGDNIPSLKAGDVEAFKLFFQEALSMSLRVTQLEARMKAMENLLHVEQVVPKGTGE
jgi:hypothetical protein